MILIVNGTKYEADEVHIKVPDEAELAVFKDGKQLPVWYIADGDEVSVLANPPHA